MKLFDPPRSQDQETVVRMVAAMAEVYGEALSDTRLEGYVGLLTDIPLDALRAGLQRAMKASSWLPKPADIRRAVDQALDVQKLAAGLAPQIAEDDDPRVSMWCRDCEDLGLIYVTRETRLHVAVSQVTGSHAQWGVRPCPCVPQNPVIQRRYPKGRYSE